MAAEPQWNISLRERDKKWLIRWQRRVSQVHKREVTITDAVRLAVSLAESLPDEDVKRGYA